MNPCHMWTVNSLQETALLSHKLQDLTELVD